MNAVCKAQREREKNLACQEPREHKDTACHLTKERKTFKSLSYIHEMRLTTCRSVYNALRVNSFCNIPVKLGMIDTLYTVQLECWNPKFAVGAYSVLED